MPTDCPSTLDLLHQSEIWVDANGNTHQIPDMEIRHARNVIRLLERNAKRLHSAENWSFMCGPMPRGEQAAWDFERGMDQFMSMDPLVWIRSTDLVQALYQRIGEPVDGVQKPDLSGWNNPEDAVYDEPPDWLDEQLPGEDPEFGHPVHRYGTDRRGSAYVVVQRAAGGFSADVLRYSHPQAARDAADYLNTLTRWEIAP